MAKDKKQKVMLGVLAALVIGMGSYWFVWRGGDSGGSGTAVKTGGGKVQREKREPKRAKKQRTRRVNKGSAAKAEKATREKTERKSKKKSRRGSRASKVKKKRKTLPPAAYLHPKDDWLEDFDPNSFRPRLT